MSNHPAIRAMWAVAIWWLAASDLAADKLTTWDGRHDVSRIHVTTVYFVPRDRAPLPDWKERVQYFARRIERFHQREFHGQSQLTVGIHPEPFRSEKSSEQLRGGDANFIFFETLREVDAQLKVDQGERTAFPILLVLSEINWRELDDFYRIRTVDGKPTFEGQIIDQRHFPGAESGGARAAYLADRGTGWGLVSADGWRVPYSGTDCVVYHEGVGHTIGLPHPEPGNGSVMSLAQYRGWINESWLDDDQKKRLGWTPPAEVSDRSRDLFSTFTAIPEPRVPQPGAQVSLKVRWPKDRRVQSGKVRIQTDLVSPWEEVAELSAGAAPDTIPLKKSFPHPTPVSYRVDVTLDDGQSVELWGYFQVRSQPDALVVPN